MNAISNLIQRIGMINVESAPVGDWERIDFESMALVTYFQSNSSFLKGGSSTSFLSRVTKSNGKHEYAADLALELREAMYNESPEKGAWFYMKMVIKSDGNFDVNFDYETKPTFSIEMDDLDFIKDYQKFPRDKGIMPSWLLEILSRNKVV